MIKAVVFDLDDTLYPEIEYVQSGFEAVGEEVLQKFGIENAAAELYGLFLEDKSNVFDRYADLHGLGKQAAVVLIDKYRSHKPNIQLRPEARETLVSLKERGYKLGIITDGRPDGQRNKIHALGLDDLTDKIIITDELGGTEFRKPNLKAFGIMFDCFRARPNETVYVGDNPRKDFVVGEIGVHTVRLLSKGLYNNDCYLRGVEPEYLINGISEITRCLND